MTAAAIRRRTSPTGGRERPPSAPNRNSHLRGRAAWRPRSGAACAYKPPPPSRPRMNGLRRLSVSSASPSVSPATSPASSPTSASGAGCGGPCRGARSGSALAIAGGCDAGSVGAGCSWRTMRAAGRLCRGARGRRSVGGAVRTPPASARWCLAAVALDVTRPSARVTRPFDRSPSSPALWRRPSTRETVRSGRPVASRTAPGQAEPPRAWSARRTRRSAAVSAGSTDIAGPNCPGSPGESAKVADRPGPPQENRPLWPILLGGWPILLGGGQARSACGEGDPQGVAAPEVIVRAGRRYAPDLRTALELLLGLRALGSGRAPCWARGRASVGRAAPPRARMEWPLWRARHRAAGKLGKTCTPKSGPERSRAASGVRAARGLWRSERPATRLDPL